MLKFTFKLTVLLFLFSGIIPEFLGTVDETQYGVEGRAAQILTYIRGYPEPKIMWFFKGEKLLMDDKYSCTLASSGELTLEIAGFNWGDVGDYKIYIENDFGSASQIINLDMAGQGQGHIGAGAYSWGV